MNQKHCVALALVLPVLAALVFSLGTPTTSFAGALCYWAGESYSEGACKKNDCINDKGQLCLVTGTWGDCGTCSLGQAD
jgi:hypothetical protein